jgi:clan AA aspartic protease (TIGR02281 family)
MSTKSFVLFPLNFQTVKICLLIGLIAHGMLWLSLGYSATYHCRDESGARVLTDNPAQLHDCTQLPTQTPSSINEAAPTSQIQNVRSDRVSNPAPHDTQLSDNSISLEEESPDSHPTGEITVPLSKNGGSLVVHVMLNQERSAQLIVDTGASMTVLSSKVAIDLGILGTTDNELLTVNTAGGSVQVNMNYLSSLTVGTAQATNVAVAIHDLPDMPEYIEGLLGMSFLKHFLVTLDAEHARLILRPKQKH